MLALVRLAQAAVSRVGFGRTSLALRRLAVGGAAGAGGSALFGALAGDDDKPRRRRRRRVFTANDRADISFISATLGAPAGKQVAMIIAARA